ncbi:apolipoprotein N-acyltransferase [Roseinatronobacter sp.]|uniref:apolipoprotein N-acyltransferase n=1 Tax=Roseinatronobacter sp. TaxID=1945755 RepID=UPI0025F3F8DF|nr:apolipoprotein N-acyltransferase [Roseibaca sp.]
MRLPPQWLVAPALGAVMALGHAPLGWWWATLLAATALFSLMPPTPRGATRWLWLGGLGYFGLALVWIVQPFFINPAVHGWMAPFALAFMAGGMALFWAGAGLAARFGPVLVAVIFLALELLRGWVLTGFPWAMLGHVLIDTPLVQLASLGGAGLLSGIVLGVAALLGLAQTWRGRMLGSGVMIAVLAAAWVWGAARGPSDMAQTGPVVRLVQPNAPQTEKWDQARALFFFERMLDQTATPAQNPPALIVWPETSVPFLLDYPGAAFGIMADAASTHGPDTQIGFGVQRLDAGRYFNSLAILDTKGQVGQVYDKHHLVPFGEYIPFAEWIADSPVGGLAGQALQGYSPGPGPRALDLGPLGRALPLICYEAIFPRHSRIAPRPDWLLQVTNDAWFGTFSGPYQHLAQARLRAVEQGLPLLRSANTGVSAGFDGYGQPLGQLVLGEDGFIDIALPPALPPTPYARWGDVPIWALLVLLAVSLAAARRFR